MLNDEFNGEVVLNNIFEGVVINDLSGAIVYANNKACEILGMTQDQIQGKSPMDPHWRAIKEDMSPFEGSDHPSFHTLATEQPKLNVVMGVFHHNDELRWININSNPIFEAGKLKAAVVSFTDVTKQINDRRLITQQSKYLEIILATTPIIVFALDTNFVITYSKGNVLCRVGIEDYQLIGLSVYDVFKENTDVLAKTEESMQGITHHYQTNVAGIDLISHMTPTYDLNGKINGIMGISYDITENENAKKAMMLQTKQAQIGEMLSMIAHQWRQPLAAINANLIHMRLKTCMDECKPEIMLPLIEKAETTVEHLSETINTFRDFFKPDKSKEHKTLGSIIDSVLSLMQAAMTAQDIEVTMSEATRELEVYTYQHDLIQVFINLFQNIIDIIKMKELLLNKIQINGIATKDTIVIEVCDNAGGIEPEHMEKIFLPYFTTKDNLQGTGLGLYMSKKIIEEHCQGSMSVSNKEDGAAFKIELPV